MVFFHLQPYKLKMTDKNIISVDTWKAMILELWPRSEPTHTKTTPLPRPLLKLVEINNVDISDTLINVNLHAKFETNRKMNKIVRT